jgi:hypothetical protein
MLKATTRNKATDKEQAPPSPPEGTIREQQPLDIVNMWTCVQAAELEQEQEQHAWLHAFLVSRHLQPPVAAPPPL